MLKIFEGFAVNFIENYKLFSFIIQSQKTFLKKTTDFVDELFQFLTSHLDIRMASIIECVVSLLNYQNKCRVS